MASPVFTENSPFTRGEQAQGGKPMTFTNTMNKSIGLFALVLVTMALGWMFLPPAALLPIVLVSLGLGLWAGFSKTPKPALYMTALGVYGLGVGAISGYLEQIFPGVVVQAVLATVVVIAVTFALYRSGKFRVTPRMNKIFAIAVTSYLLFSLVNLVLMVTNVTEGMFGLRSDVTIFGIPLGVVLGIFAVLMGSYSLVMDFDYIEQGIARRIPEIYGWTAAYGLVMTIVWIYFELLRLISILRN